MSERVTSLSDLSTAHTQILRVSLKEKMGRTLEDLNNYGCVQQVGSCYQERIITATLRELTQGTVEVKTLVRSASPNNVVRHGLITRNCRFLYNSTLFAWWILELKDSCNHTPAPLRSKQQA